jgi:hypothetical protein
VKNLNENGVLIKSEFVKRYGLNEAKKIRESDSYDGLSIFLWVGHLVQPDVVGQDAQSTGV